MADAALSVEQAEHVAKVVTKAVLDEIKPLLEANAKLREEIARLKMGIEMLAIAHKVTIPDGFW